MLFVQRVFYIHFVFKKVENKKQRGASVSNFLISLFVLLLNYNMSISHFLKLHLANSYFLNIKHVNFKIEIPVLLWIVPK